MIKHEVTSLERYITSVNGKAVFCLIHDTAPIGPGTVHGRRCRVSHMFRYAACGIREVVDTVPLHKPRPLLKLGHHFITAARPIHLGLQLTERFRITIAGHLFPSILKRDHIIVQFTVPKTFIAPEKIGTAVIVNEYRRVNKAESLGQRFAYGIPPWALRIICNSHSQGIAAGGYIAADIPVPLAVALHTL
ncbi:MAG: hypothetical protein BWY95_01664 [Bacteroidetes bacterium ADurb.BinA104]|nr:MAG: hypothetical protein BWY95_01664 [Bacteroidetes bacterium ADurb.BinA104]